MIEQLLKKEKEAEVLKFYNSLTRTIEEFKPINSPSVGMYSCGPTVYGYAHIGHLRRYVGDDIIKRVLALDGFQVKHVMNITDVGHLTSDADEGEDKMEKGAKLLGKSVWEVAKFFEEQFFISNDALNIKRADIVCRATEHIDAQIDLIKKLEARGFTYQSEQGIYFDISKFANYTKLSGQNLDDLKTAVREDVVSDPAKKHPADFALWIFTVGRFANHTMRWVSPWGEGFPGWHIECSAMSMKYLGETFDIHTGGIDHIPTHHTNEIAQSEAATGKPFANYFIHHEFLMVDGKKMSKSLGNLYTIDDIKNHEINPLALRYLYLTTHYRDPLNFTWESLKASETALSKLYKIASVTKETGEETRNTLSDEKLTKIDQFRSDFSSFLNDDFNTPKALAIVWKALKSNIPHSDKYDLLMYFDEILGLCINANLNVGKKEVTVNTQKLLEERENFRKEGNFEAADKIRDQLIKMGYTLVDDKV
ncbi:cysteine--tRNA ligase [Candidatus Woesebacteria bacterium]|nr:cysteine--tRNA ligase [Candidatus Woesebacteria bacterium]QQG47380.1 MAG: cysteine--tRNA ligase [Candidatus Woesebacteria bacterium]